MIKGSNRSTHEMNAADSAPLRLHTMNDGRVKCTTILAPSKEWFGEDEQLAVQACKNELRRMWEEGELDPAPRWAEEFHAKS